MDFHTVYQEKLCSAEQAVSLIPSCGVIGMGMRAATPPALVKALADRARAGGIEKLDVYYLRCGKIAMETIFQEDLMGKFRPHSSMLTRAEMDLAAKGFEKGKKYVYFVPISFSQYPRIISETVSLDAFIVTVAPPDKSGSLNFGIHGDYAIELSRKAKKLIVEVNENMPRITGRTMLHLSEVDAIVENNCPLLEELSKEPEENDHKIAKLITSLIPDGATIQIGIGSVPNAVCQGLINHKDLGVHTEVISSGLVDLIQRGVITNRKKTLYPYQTVFTFATGTKEMYEFLDDNPSICCLPVSYVNDPYVIGQNDGMVSVNSFLEIDFSGQVNAEFLGHQFSGPGGQLDFVRGAYYSKGGKSILASHSTGKNGQVSKIVPRLNSLVTDTRIDIDYVATEYGCCKLRGKSTTERTLALIELAHPKFREELLQKAKEQNFI